jgi:hypothetical protein
MGMFDWIEWEGHKYQTKDTPNQLCDEYAIDQLGRLMVEEYDAELVRDPEHVFGVYIQQNNRRWRECVEFSGKLRFLSRRYRLRWIQKQRLDRMGSRIQMRTHDRFANVGR